MSQRKLKRIPAKQQISIKIMQRFREARNIMYLLKKLTIEEYNQSIRQKLMHMEQAKILYVVIKCNNIIKQYQND